MAQNPFDQASRYAAKLDAAGFLAWLLREQPAALGFRGWLDTRTLPFPGDPERTCDTVAWLEEGDPAVPWALVVEFSLEPEGALFGRLLVYLGQVWLERRPTDGRGDRFQVGAVVVNLTGRGHTSRDLRLRQTGVRTCLEVAERDLAREDAAATLDGIAAGTVARCLLPWIPLMIGGGEAVIMERWLELARAEPDAARRADYGGLALVFSEAAGRRPAWKQALEGWEMVQSQQVLEWQMEAEVKGQIKSLLRFLERRFSPVPPDLAERIRATTDPARLDQWIDAVAVADSLAAFRQASGL